MGLAFNLEGKGGGKSKFEPLSEGTHVVRLVRLVDLGLQRDEYQGEVSERYKIFITFESPDETVMIEGKAMPKFISAELTVSSHEQAKLPKFIKALIPGSSGDINLGDLVGKCAQVSVGRTAGGNAKILGIMPLAKGQQVTETETKLEIYDLTNGKDAVFKALPKFVQEKIEGRIGGGKNSVDENPSLPPVM